MTTGRVKGILFERKICVELSEWWSNGQRTDIFWRSNSSGARATARSKRGKDTPGQYGDVAAIDPIGAPFLAVSPVELKRGYPKVSVHDVLDPLDNRKQEPEFSKWWQQARNAATACHAPGWLLITSRYSKQPLVWMPVRLRRKLIEQGAILEGVYPMIRIQREHDCIFGMTLESFFCTVRPKQYITIYEQMK